jgi:hypothetical protein
VWNASHFIVGGLGGANVHAAIEETRIGRDDLAFQALCKLNGQLRFANGGGADDKDKGRFVHYLIIEEPVLAKNGFLYFIFFWHKWLYGLNQLWEVFMNGIPDCPIVNSEIFMD